MQQSQLSNNTLPNKYINGLRFEWASTTTITVGAGQCRDYANSMDLVVDEEKTVSISGSGALGLDTGTVAANSWYGVYIIGSSTNRAPTTIIASLSGDFPSPPEGYDAYRRIGWLRTNASSQIKNFRVHGGSSTRKYFWMKLELAYGGASSATFVDLDLSDFMPSTSSIAYLNLGYTATQNTNVIYMRMKGSTEDNYDTVTLSGNGITHIFPFNTSDDQIMQYRSTNAGDEVHFYPYGFEDYLD